MLKFIVRFINYIDHYGIMYIFSLFIPCYFTQDNKQENDGWDLITFKKTNMYYYHGLFKDNPFYK